MLKFVPLFPKISLISIYFKYEISIKISQYFQKLLTPRQNPSSVLGTIPLTTLAVYIKCLDMNRRFLSEKPMQRYRLIHTNIFLVLSSI